MTSNSKPMTVALVYGGKSGEHDVSLQTALAVVSAFDYQKYRIVPFYISSEGVINRGGALVQPVTAVADLQFVPPSNGKNSSIHQHRVQGISNFLLGCLDEQVDVVFPLLHGTYGEDGTIQGLLEMAHLPYVGAGVLASACGMDKVAMKRMFGQSGLPQCVYRSFYDYQWHNDYDYWVTEIEVTLGYPCFVKPANLGSSVGVGKAHNRDELLAAVEEACRYDRRVIVEEFIDGREVEVSVLGNEVPEASLPGEIISSNEFYDYHAKYIDGKSQMSIPAQLNEEQTAEIRALALKAYRAIDAAGLSRVDFFLRRDTGEFLLNEINTMPGFTPFSMYPLMWKASGKPYAELLDDLIRLAIERAESRSAISYARADFEKERV